MNLLKLLLGVIVFVASTCFAYRRVCYYYDPNSLPVTRVNISLCTHLIYLAGMGYANSSMTLLRSDIDGPAISYLKQLQRDKGGFQLMVCYTPDTRLDPLIFGSPEKLADFANATTAFLLHYGFDGLDIDWEYPMAAGRSSFSAFLTALRQSFNSSKPSLLMSAAVPSVAQIIIASYDVPVLAQTLDFIDIMGYDMRAWVQGYPLTAHHSQLYASEYDVSYLGTLNVNWSVNYFIAHGVQRGQIVIGIPSYSHGYHLVYDTENGVMVPANGPGSTDGMNRTTICEFLKKNGTVYRIDTHAHAPYAFNDLDWATFDDEYSVGEKIRYIKDNNLGGTMVWALPGDTDFDRSCDSGDFPIHTIITKLLA